MDQQKDPQHEVTLALAWLVIAALVAVLLYRFLGG